MTIKVLVLADHQVAPQEICDLLADSDDIDVIVAGGPTDSTTLAETTGYLLTRVRSSTLIDMIRDAEEPPFAARSHPTTGTLGHLTHNLDQKAPVDERLAILTEQERKILTLIAEGMTNRQIAAELFLAEKTIKNYVSSLLAKLGMERRTQAAVFAVSTRGHDSRPSVGITPHSEWTSCNGACRPT